MRQPTLVRRSDIFGLYPSSVTGATFTFPPAQAYTTPWEDGGALLRRSIGVVLVAVAVGATASARARVPTRVEGGFP